MALTLLSLGTVQSCKDSTVSLALATLFVGDVAGPLGEAAEVFAVEEFCKFTLMHLQNLLLHWLMGISIKVRLHAPVFMLTVKLGGWTY